ncbi:hypothetical protein IGI04_035656, partial [Brassica rapa subsp. trilocularis]
MAQDDAAFGAPGEEPTPTPAAAPPITSDFMSSVMARLARQDEVQKTTNDQLAALVAALTAPEGQTSRPQLTRRRLFNTNPTAAGEDTNAILSKMSAPKAPAAKNANARQEPRQHAPNDKNGRKDGYMYVVNENNAPISTLVVRGEGWNKWVRELESSDQKVDSVCTTQPAAGEETPRDNGGGDSSADEEHPANRRRIEVILSQQSLSSDEDNDDSPVPGDLRDSLKRRLAPENGSDTTRRDLRTMLDARKSRRISTSDGNNNEGPIGDLRDKLNAGVSDLRVKLNKSKPTDLRRQLEQAKGQPQLPPPDTS